MNKRQRKKAHDKWERWFFRPDGFFAQAAIGYRIWIESKSRELVVEALSRTTPGLEGLIPQNLGEGDESMTDHFARAMEQLDKDNDA